MENSSQFHSSFISFAHHSFFQRIFENLNKNIVFNRNYAKYRRNRPIDQEVNFMSICFEANNMSLKFVSINTDFNVLLSKEEPCTYLSQY